MNAPPVVPLPTPRTPPAPRPALAEGERLVPTLVVAGGLTVLGDFLLWNHSRVSRGRSMSNRSPSPAAPAAADRVWRASFASVCRSSCCSRSSSASSPRAKRVAGAARASRDAPRRPGPRRSANRPARDGANSARTTLGGGLARTPVPNRPQRARPFRLGREAERPPLRREGVHDHQGLLPDAGRAGIRSMRAAGR